MAENPGKKAKELSISDLKRNLDDEYTGTTENALQKETIEATNLKTQDDFRLVGKNYIENIKASLLASSANFNRAKYAATLEDPYMKAYRYLEEHKVLALFEDLITHTAFQRPSEPFPFMAKLVQEFYADSEQKGGLLKRDWKRRYFVLYQDGELVYYETAGSQICVGKINVRQNCQRIDYGLEVEHDIQQKASGRVNCLFSIRSSVKNITVLADTEQDARDWVQKLNGIRQSAITMIPGVPQPGNVYQPGIPYPTHQPQMGYPTQYPPPSTPYPTQGGMPQPYPVAPTYQNPPLYNQPMGAQPPVMYGQYPAGYQTQPLPPAGYGYPVYQQQQYYQAPQSRGGLSSRRGLLAGAAGGAVAGGLLGFGMGHAVGGWGDSFDGDCDFDCGCD